MTFNHVFMGTKLCTFTLNLTRVLLPLIIHFIWEVWMLIWTLEWTKQAWKPWFWFTHKWNLVQLAYSVNANGIASKQSSGSDPKTGSVIVQQFQGRRRGGTCQTLSWVFRRPRAFMIRFKFNSQFSPSAWIKELWTWQLIMSFISNMCVTVSLIDVANAQFQHQTDQNTLINHLPAHPNCCLRLVSVSTCPPCFCSILIFEFLFFGVSVCHSGLSVWNCHWS